MDSFLCEQRAQGVQHSTGTFTIDGRLAREKMAHQLADPGAYILKFVQAAVALSASEIRVVVTRKELRLAFTACDSELANLSAVTSAMSSVASLRRSALRHLAVGLNAANGQKIAEVHWQTSQGTLRVTPAGIEILPEPHDGYQIVVVKARSLMDWLRGSLFHQELACLAERCTYVPARLSLDGREIHRPIWNRFGYEVPLHFGLPQPHILVDYRQSESEALWLAYPPARSYQEAPEMTAVHIWNGDRAVAMLAADVVVPLIIAGWDGEAPILPASAAVGMAPCAQGAGRIIPVLDGVRLEPIEDLDLGQPGVQVVLDAAELTTDLSEFGVVRDQHLGQALERARRTVAEARLSVTSKDFVSCLRATGIPADCVESLANQCMVGLTTPEDLVQRRLMDLVAHHLKGERLYIGSDIKAATAIHLRDIHRAHWPSEEVLLAVYDDTMFGSASEGFAVTGRRLLWKCTFSSPNYALWEEIAGTQPSVVKDGIEVLGAIIGVALAREASQSLCSFLSHLGELQLEPSHSHKSEVWHLLKTGVQSLGKWEKFAYHPYISRHRIEKLGPIYGLAVGEEPLISYDDTLSGDGENGWMATLDRVLWKNSFEGAQSLDWSAIKENLASIEVTSEGVRVGEHKISAYVTELRPRIADFFRKMAASDIL